MELAADLPASVRLALERRNFPLELFETLLRLPPEVGVLLVGSHAEGIATAVSDLDVLVLLEGDEELPPPGAGASLVPVAASSTVVERYLLLAHDLELDVEVVRDTRIAGVETMTGEFALVAGGEVPATRGLPTLQTLELRVLSRLRTGIPLGGAERVESWRRRLHLDLLPHFVAAVAFVRALSYAEDAYSIDDTGEGDAARLSAAIAARGGAEAVVAAALATHGVVASWDLKAAPRHVARLRREGVELAPVLLELEELLFPAGGELGRRRIDSVYESAVRLFEHLRDKGSMPGVVAYLRTYGRDRWQLDLSFLHA